MTDNPVQITGLVTSALESLNIPYFVGGSLASIFYGMVRTTQDADLVALLETHHVTPFVRALQDDFFVDEHMIRDAVSHHSSFNIIHQESMFKIDIFVPRLRDFERSQLKRAKMQTLMESPQVRVRLSSAEDILLAKLEWYRMGDEISERQWRDIIGILKVQAGNLDLPYLRRYAASLGVEDLLARALKETAET